MATLALGVAFAVVGGASMASAADRAAGSTGGGSPSTPVDAQLLLDLDVLRDPELTQRRTLLERLRMIESLRLLERLNLFEAQTSPTPPPPREAR
jgi:hypothetical protein